MRLAISIITSFVEASEISLYLSMNICPPSQELQASLDSMISELIGFKFIVKSVWFMGSSFPPLFHESFVSFGYFFEYKLIPHGLLLSLPKYTVVCFGSLMEISSL